MCIPGALLLSHKCDGSERVITIKGIDKDKLIKATLFGTITNCFGHPWHVRSMENSIQTCPPLLPSKFSFSLLAKANLNFYIIYQKSWELVISFIFLMWYSDEWSMYHRVATKTTTRWLTALRCDQRFKMPYISSDYYTTRRMLPA